MLDFKKFLFMCGGFSTMVSASREVKSLPKESWLKVKNLRLKRHTVGYFIDGIGICDFLQRSHRLDKKEKQSLVQQIKGLGITVSG